MTRGAELLDLGASVERSARVKPVDEYREVLDRCRNLHTELEKEREAGKFTFAELEENEEDLVKLEAWLDKIRARDRFGAPLAQEAEEAIRDCRDDLYSFAESVYEAADHGSTNPLPRERKSKGLADG